MPRDSQLPEIKQVIQTKKNLSDYPRFPDTQHPRKPLLTARLNRGEYHEVVHRAGESVTILDLIIDTHKRHRHHNWTNRC